MITVTVTIMSFLYIQSSNSEISVTVVPENRIECVDGQTERYSGEVLVTTTARITEINVTDHPAEKTQEALFTNFQSLQIPDVTRKTELKDESIKELLQPFFIAKVNSTVNNHDWYPNTKHIFSNNSTIGDDDEKYKLKEIAHTQIHSSKYREEKHDKMINNKKSMIMTNNIEAVKNRASTDQLKLYDLPYKIHDYGYTEDHISADEIGWKTIGRPENTQPAASWVEGILDHPSYGTRNHDELSLPNRVIKGHYRPMQLKENKINWHTISIIALIKLGLIKLKTIGFVKILFLILFKLKLYMTAVFVKFLLIVKLMKFSKSLILPLLILKLLPILIKLFSMKSSNNMINSPGNTLPNQSNGLTSSQFGNLLPGVTRPVTFFSDGTTGSGMTDGTTGTGLSGETTGTGLPSGITETGLPSITTGTGRPGITIRTVQEEENKISSFKTDDLNLVSKKQNKSSIMFDPTWEIIQNVLNSEKCIERTACQISVAEKAGLMPIWINWIIYYVSTFIASDKLEIYLKTYENVNNDIFNKSIAAENWITWCLDRYKCQ